MNQNRIRLRQLDYNINVYRDKLGEWDIPNRGCGAVSLATILVNYSFNIDPIDVVKKIIIDKNGTFDNTYLAVKGIKPEGIFYALDRLINEDKMNIKYETVRIDFANPLEQKQVIINNIRNGNMAIIYVGPKDGYLKYKGLFSKFGHYLVVSDVDLDDNFYVLNSNKLGDGQIGMPFSYNDLINEIYGRCESFNFLFIKKL